MVNMQLDKIPQIYRYPKSFVNMQRLVNHAYENNSFPNIGVFPRVFFV